MAIGIKIPALTSETSGTGSSKGPPNNGEMISVECIDYPQIQIRFKDGYDAYQGKWAGTKLFVSESEITAYGQGTEILDNKIQNKYENEPFIYTADTEGTYYFAVFAYSDKNVFCEQITLSTIMSITITAGIISALPTYTGENVLVGNSKKGHLKMTSSGTLTLSSIQPEYEYTLVAVGCGSNGANGGSPGANGGTADGARSGGGGTGYVGGGGGGGGAGGAFLSTTINAPGEYTVTVSTKPGAGNDHYTIVTSVKENTQILSAASVGNGGKGGTGAGSWGGNGGSASTPKGSVGYNGGNGTKFLEELFCSGGGGGGGGGINNFAGELGGKGGTGAGGGGCGGYGYNGGSGNAGKGYDASGYGCGGGGGGGAGYDSGAGKGGAGKQGIVILAWGYTQAEMFE